MKAKCNNNWQKKCRQNGRHSGNINFQFKEGVEVELPNQTTP